MHVNTGNSYINADDQRSANGGTAEFTFKNRYKNLHTIMRICILPSPINLTLLHMRRSIFVGNSAGPVLPSVNLSRAVIERHAKRLFQVSYARTSNNVAQKMPSVQNQRKRRRAASASDAKTIPLLLLSIPVLENVQTFSSQVQSEFIQKPRTTLLSILSALVDHVTEHRSRALGIRALPEITFYSICVSGSSLRP